MNRGKKLVKNTAILGFGNLLPKFASIIILPIYTGMLTKLEYGTYDLINTLGSLLIPIVTLQLKQAVFRFMIDCRKDDGDKQNQKIVSSAFLFVGTTSLVSILILFFFLSDNALHIRVLICLYLWLETIVDIIKQVVRGIGEVKVYSISSIVHSIANIIFVLVLLLFLKTGFWGMLLSLNMAMLLSAIYLLCRIKIKELFSIHAFEKSILVSLLKYSIPMVPSSISLWVVSVSDRLVITSFMGLEATAIYAIANKIPNLLGQAYGVFNLSWQENASEFSKDEDSQQYYSLIFDNLFNLLVGITAMLIATTPILFKLLISNAYDESYGQMPILYFGVFFNCLTAYYGGIYVALKKTVNLGLSSVSGAIINLLINLLLIRRIGLYAASLSTLISYMLICIYRLVDTKKWRKIEYNWKKIGLYLGLLVGMSIVCYQRTWIFDIINFIFGIVFACIVNRKILIQIIEGVIFSVSKKVKIP